MTNPGTDSYRNVTRYLGQDYRFTPTYLRRRDPTTADIKPKEQQGHYPITSLWTNTSNQNIWALAGIVNNLAQWIMLSSGGGGPLINLTLDSGATITPSALGNMIFNGTNNGQGTTPVSTATSVAHEFFLNVQTANVAASSTPTLNGLSHFNSAQFTVGAGGFVSLVGSGGEAVDTLTGNTGGAVSPSAGGNINVKGTTTINVTGTPGTNTLDAEVSFTNNAFLLGQGFGTTATTIGPLTNGQVIIGSTGAAPVASTLTAGNNITIINGSGSTTIASGASNVVGVTNIGVSYAAGIFSITSSNGSALSAGNPGYVTIPSLLNPGQLVTISITANQTFQDNASGGSFLAGNSFGVTSTGTYNQDMPFFIYAVLNLTETAINFAFSRIPHLRFTPNATTMGKQGSAVASTQSSMFLFGNPTVANFSSASTYSIGAFRMQSTAAVADWTVQALNQHDGIGNWEDDQTFIIPTGSFGASTGSFFANNGGTAPIWTNQVNAYKITKFGIMHAWCNMITLSNTPAGAVTAQMAIPFISLSLNIGGFNLGGNAVISQAGVNQNLGVFQAQTNLCQFSLTGGGTLLNSGFTTATPFNSVFCLPISKVL